MRDAGARSDGRREGALFVVGAVCAGRRWARAGRKGSATWRAGPERVIAEGVGFEPTPAFRSLRFSRPFRASHSSRTNKYLCYENQVLGLGRFRYRIDHNLTSAARGRDTAIDTADRHAAPRC